MSLLKERQAIGSYTVQTFIKKGMYDETYFVGDASGTRHFMKLFMPAEVPAVAKDNKGRILEIEYARGLHHPHVLTLEDSGTFEVGGLPYPFLVTSFVDGQLLESHLLSGHRFDVDTTLEVAMCLLGALSHLHGQQLLHCDITPRNIIFNERDGHATATLIDLGHLARHPLASPTFLTADLEPWYRAPETYRGQFGPASDLFSLSAVLYTMLYGQAPWKTDVLQADDDDAAIRSKVHMARKAPLSFDSRTDVPLWLQGALQCALMVKPDQRLGSADQMMELLAKRGADTEAKSQRQPSSGHEPSAGIPLESEDDDADKRRRERGQMSTSVEFEKPLGNGFADVAGMDDLKTRLSQRVLFVLKNKEKAQAYKACCSMALPAAARPILLGSSPRNRASKAVS